MFSKYLERKLRLISSDACFFIYFEGFFDVVLTNFTCLYSLEEVCSFNRAAVSTHRVLL